MMQHLPRVALVAAIALATVVAAPLITAADDAGDDAEPLDGAAVDRYVAEYLETTGLPGAAVAITRGIEVVHRRQQPSHQPRDETTLTGNRD